MPSAAEFAAWVGAGAWIPIVIGALYASFVRPSVTISTENFVEIGYTTYGPIFNLNMGIAVDRKDAVIEALGVKLTHESGAVHHLKWRGMSETFSQIRDARGTQQTVGKEHLTIALRLSQHMLTERHVRFQDPSFHQVVANSSGPLTAHLHFLRSNNQMNEAPASQQFHDFVQAISNHFWWIVGTYDVEFYFRSPHRAKLKKRKWQFSLTQLDLERLQGNRDLIAEDLERTIVGPQAGGEPQDGEEPQEGAEPQPDAQPQPIGWQWVNPALNVVE